MSAHQITTLIFRMLALAWFLYLFDHAGSLLIYFNEGRLEHPSSLALSTAFTLLQFCCSAALWFHPATLAAKILPSALADKPRPAPTPLEWQTIGVISVGLWTRARAIPDATYWITLMGLLHHDDGLSSTPLAPNRIAGVVSTAIELPLGLWLVFGARGFAAFLFQVRTAGLRVKADDAGPA